MSIYAILFVVLLSAGLAGFTLLHVANWLINSLLNKTDFWGEK
jgi:hypothetical protein